MKLRRRLHAILNGALVGGLFLWSIGTGFWLLSETTYTYPRSVGGATCIGAGLGAFIAVICKAADNEW